VVVVFIKVLGDRILYQKVEDCDLDNLN
jgi:hypothetical protein